MVKDADPLAPLASAAVTVTFDVSAVAVLTGVPEMTPDRLIDRPFGRFRAVHVRVLAAESVACGVSVSFVPAATSSVPGSVTEIVSPAVVLAKAVMPSGVPRPVGPSYPGSPWHR
jgi:hypothetical protein